MLLIVGFGWAKPVPIIWKIFPLEKDAKGYLCSAQALPRTLSALLPRFYYGG